MTEKQPAETALREEMQRSEYAITRDQFVDRFFLPSDRAYLEDSKILDEFYQNPTTGYDGLLHIFCGEKRDTAAFGYHLATTAPDTQTFERTLRPEDMSPSAQKVFVKHDFEPYSANVIIQGIEKKTGASRTLRGNKRAGVNAMFPAAYDPFAVIQSLLSARDNRDRSKDTLIEKRIAGNTRAVGFQAPILLVDNQTPMIVNMTVEEGTDKIISAFPRKVIGAPPLLAHLSSEDINNLLVG